MLLVDRFMKTAPLRPNQSLQEKKSLRAANPLSKAVKLFNKVAQLGKFERRYPGSFAPNALIDEAAERVGHDRFSTAFSREGFEVLLDSLDRQTNLHYLGRCAMRRQLISFLRNALELDSHFLQDDKATLIYEPIIIIGMPRVGSTHLQRLLTFDPNICGLPLDWLLSPFGGFVERRRIHWEMEFWARALPTIDDIHYTRGNTPEECQVLFCTFFKSPFFWACAPVYDYLEWYQQAALMPCYRAYRRLLAVFQRHHEGRRLVMKSTSHLLHLRELFETFPDAHVIHLHRDPATVCASTCSLIHTMHGFFCERSDPKRLGRLQQDLLISAMEAAMTVRREVERPVLDLYYNDLVRSPLSTLEAVYRFCGLSFSDRKSSPEIKRNDGRTPWRHRYALSDFDLSVEEIGSRFDSYIAEFGPFETMETGLSRHQRSS